MGITNLLVFLKPLTEIVHLSKYKGEHVGVDAMCWMHRGAVACAYDLLFAKQASHKFIQFVMKMISLLLEYDIKPLLVFDGKKLPLKAFEEEKRRERREQAKEKSEKMLKAGTKLNNEKLRSLAVQAIHVTQDMVNQLIQALKRARIEYLVAPYEADAQLAFLCRTNAVKAVITEDSDLLAYGCPRVLFKLTTVGEAQEVNLDKIIYGNSSFYTNEFLCHKPDEHERVKTDDENGCRQAEPATHEFDSDFEDQENVIYNKAEQTSKKGIQKGSAKMSRENMAKELSQFDWSMFVTMCVLTGCDYTKNVHIPGLGIHMSFHLAKTYKTLDHVFGHLMNDPKFSLKLSKLFSDFDPTILEGCELDNLDLKSLILNDANKSFKMHIAMHMIAAVVFSHHPVYDPQCHCIVPVHSLETSRTSSKTCLSDLVHYGRYRFKAEKLFGTFNDDDWALYCHITGNSAVASEDYANAEKLHDTKKRRVNDTQEKLKCAHFNHAQFARESLLSQYESFKKKRRFNFLQSSSPSDKENEYNTKQSNNSADFFNSRERMVSSQSNSNSNPKNTELEVPCKVMINKSPPRKNILKPKIFVSLKEAFDLSNLSRYAASSSDSSQEASSSYQSTLVKPKENPSDQNILAELSQDSEHEVGFDFLHIVKSSKVMQKRTSTQEAWNTLFGAERPS